MAQRASGKASEHRVAFPAASWPTAIYRKEMRRIGKKYKD